jgi:electron transport complex protein RnfG
MLEPREIDEKRRIPRAALSLGLVGLLAVTLLGGLHALTRERIAAQETLAQRQALAIVLPPERYDNDPLQDRVAVLAPRWLGADESVALLRARLRGQPSALVLTAVAPDGYAGPIHLLVAVAADGRVLGVRVVRHQETPGLGDAIEAAKSRWIEGFGGRSLGDPVEVDWKVKRDGGHYDQFASATVTPRAVVAAVRKALQFVAAHGDSLYRAETGGTLSFGDAPTTTQEAAR